MALTPTEDDLLTVFITHRGTILTRQHLLKELWGAHSHARIHRLHVYSAQVRQKIEPVPQDRRFLLTIPAVGYRFADEAEREQRNASGRTFQTGTGSTTVALKVEHLCPPQPLPTLVAWLAVRLSVP